MKSLKTLIILITLSFLSPAAAETTVEGYYYDYYEKTVVPMTRTRRVFIPLRIPEPVTGETIVFYARGAENIDREYGRHQASLKTEKVKLISTRKLEKTASSESNAETRVSRSRHSNFSKTNQKMGQVYQFLSRWGQSCPGTSNQSTSVENKIIPAEKNIMETLKETKPDLLALFYEHGGADFNKEGWTQLLDSVPPEVGCFLILRNDNLYVSKNISYSKDLEDLVNEKKHQCQVIYSEKSEFDPDELISTLCDRDYRSTMTLYEEDY